MKEIKNLIPGLRQVRQLIADDQTEHILIAKDADGFIKDELIGLTRDKSIKVEWVESKKLLGRLSGISISAATAAYKRQINSN